MPISSSICSPPCSTAATRRWPTASSARWGARPGIFPTLSGGRQRPGSGEAPMLDRAIFVTTFAAAVGSGVVGGIFYAFSSFVMAALGRLAPAQGADAMKAINVTVINPVFMLAFLGTAIVCLVLAGASLIWWGRIS